jgi:predicted nucleic acid-binding protein
LNSDPPPFERHDPAAYGTTLAYRSRDQLPRDLAAIPPDVPLMLDTTVYIDAQKAKLPRDLAVGLVGAEIIHSAVALGEIAAGIGLRDPGHPGTPKVSRALREILRKVDPARIVAPSADAWLEASLMAGILARTQNLSKDSRRKLLNDALILLTAAEAHAVLVSRNVKDVDLLLRLRPDAPVHVYDQTT